MASFFTASRLSFRKRKRRPSWLPTLMLAAVLIGGTATAALALMHEGII